jgi:CSLREA domain-containing protein
MHRGARSRVWMIIICVLTLASARAQIVVNSTGDDDRYPSKNGACDTDPLTDGNQCTLRAAIETANLSPDTSTISFNIPTTDPGYNAQTHSWTINLYSALPDLSMNMKMTGPGAALLIVQRSSSTTGNFRILNVTTTGSMSVSGLAISNGSTDSGGGGGMANSSSGTLSVSNCTLRGNSAPSSIGGAIYNSSTGTVKVTNCKLSDNAADFGVGGAIANNIGTINVVNSTISNNFSGLGGAIFNDSGTMTITGSKISGNISDFSSGGISGGGVTNATGTLIITKSTIANNFAFCGGGIGILGGSVSVTGSTFSGNFANSSISGGTTGGGGIWVGGGILNLTNSTVSGNGAFGLAEGGGGIFNTSAGTLNVTNSTISGNCVFARGNGSGAGVFNSAGGVANIKSSIIALNSANFAPDVSGVFTSAGFNLIGKKDGSTGFTAATDKKGTITSPLNPQLDWKGLRNNGGPTQTIALLSGSPAIDAGTSAGLTGTLTTDQRGAGYPRTVDNGSVTNPTGGDGTDIGAFEVQAP